MSAHSLRSRAPQADQEGEPRPGNPNALVDGPGSWRSWHNLRREHEVARNAFVDEQSIRLVAKAVITAILIFAGLWRSALVLAALMFGTELMGRALALYGRVRRRDRRGVFLLGGFWMTLNISVISMITPSILLSTQGSMPLFVIGALWNLGLIFYVSIHFGTMPVHNLVTLGLLSAATFIVLWFSMTNDFLRGSLIESLACVVFLVAYNAVALHTLLRQNRISLALHQAKTDAEARLAQIEYIARHDELTGLFNRRSFDEALAAMLRDCSDRVPIWVVMVDLNGFKPVNDLYSHDAGDEVLRHVARRLSELAGPKGVVARIGGDEFILAQPAMPEGHAARSLIGTIASQLREPISFGVHQLRVSAAVGLAEASDPQTKVTTICARADQAMYRSKSSLDGVPAIYSPQWDARRNPLAQRTELIGAMRAGEIVPYFQPKVDMKSGRLLGFEALARWVRPQGDVLTPSRFLPAVEDAGLGGVLVNHVAGHVGRQLRTWQSIGFCPDDVSINVSEAALATEGGCTELLAIIADFPDRKRLTLEITEDVFFARPGDPVQKSIERLRAAGCRISLDDFGTGYASFRHLRELVFDEVKIDRSFTSDLGRDRSADVLVEAVISIADSLGLQVIAEGVETEEQRQRLMAMGCRAGQGYLWNRALSAREVEEVYGAGALTAKTFQSC